MASPKLQFLNSLQPPAPMNFGGNHATEWKQWKQRFEIYLTATGQADADDKLKISLLLHSLGAEGIEIYNTFSLTADEEKVFSTVLNKFHTHFVPKSNVTYERHRFFTRNQDAAESIDQYVTALRVLARTCEFGTLLDSLIKDRRYVV